MKVITFDLISANPKMFKAPPNKLLELHSIYWCGNRSDIQSNGDAISRNGTWFLYPYERTIDPPGFDEFSRDDFLIAFAMYNSKGRSITTPDHGYAAPYSNQFQVNLFAYRCKQITFIDDTKLRIENGDGNMFVNWLNGWVTLWYKEVAGTRAQIVYEWLRKK